MCCWLRIVNLMIIQVLLLTTKQSCLATSSSCKALSGLIFLYKWDSSVKVKQHILSKIIMQKKREHVVVTEMIQVGCKWKLKGFFDHRHCRPKEMLLKKNQNKDVTGSGHPRRKINTSTLGHNCQGIKNAPEDKGVGMDDETYLPKVIQENDEMHKFALEILDTNSELFLKLLKDPNSLLIKRIRNAKNLQQAKKETVKLLYENKLADCGNNAIPRKRQTPTHSTHKSLLERIKSQYGCQPVDVEIPSTSNSIVVLKPRLTKEERDILRKYRNLELSNRATASKKLNLPNVSYVNKRDFEAKMRLSKMLRNAEAAEHCSDRQGPRTLKSILSSPLSSPEYEYSAPISQEKDADASVCLQSMIDSACSNNEYAWEGNSSPLQNLEAAISASLMKLADESQNLEPRDEIIEPAYSSDGLSCKASVNMEMSDTIKSEDLDISELSCAEQGTGTTKVCCEHRFSECSIQQDFWLENKPLNSSLVVSSSDPFSEYKVETKDASKDREEHPSSICVLESLFAKSFTGLSSNINCPAKSHMQQHDTDCEEALLIKDHSTTFLQTTGLYGEKLSKKLHSSVQLLNTSSLAEQKIFLDFIKDILLELNRRHYSFYPRASSIRQSTVASSVLDKNMMEEFLKEIQWYLVPPETPRTLEDLAVKDVKRDDNWSGTKLETEEVVIQLTDDLLEELIMQTNYVR
ncbi:uncharacterized protein LOC141702364 isoform X1 [Apium graveolens]